MKKMPPTLDDQIRVMSAMPMSAPSINSALYDMAVKRWQRPQAKKPPTRIGRLPKFCNKNIVGNEPKKEKRPIIIVPVSNENVICFF